MYCVIVGDIIHSKSLTMEKRNESTESINHVLKFINGKYESDILANFGIVRGDALEGVLFSPLSAPEIIQDIIMNLFERDVKVRIGAAVGDLSVVSAERNEADGPAFYAALRRIEKLRKNDSDHWFQVSLITSSMEQPLVDSLLQLIAALTEGWTEKQAQAVWGMVRYGNKQSLVSEKLKITASVVSKQLRAAHYDAYRKAWSALREYLTEVEEKTAASKETKRSYTTQYTIANRKMEQGNYSDAIAFYQESLLLGIKDFGKESPNLVKVYNGLANGYLEALNTKIVPRSERDAFLQKVDETLTAAIQCQKVRSGMQSEFARTAALFGDYYLLSGKDDKAMAQYKEALRMLEYCHQSEYLWTWECYNNMADIYERRGERQKAEEMTQKVLEYAEQNIELYPVPCAIMLANIGYFYKKWGRGQEALKVLKVALNEFMDYLPAKDPRIQDIASLIVEIQPKE